MECCVADGGFVCVGCHGGICCMRYGLCNVLIACVGVVLLGVVALLSHVGPTDRRQCLVIVWQASSSWPWFVLHVHKPTNSLTNTASQLMSGSRVPFLSSSSQAGKNTVTQSPTFSRKTRSEVENRACTRRQARTTLPVHRTVPRPCDSGIRLLRDDDRT